MTHASIAARVRLVITERYPDGHVSRVIDGTDAGGYESTAQIRLLARSRGWAQVRDIPGGIQHLTRGVLSDSSWGPMLVDVVLVDVPETCSWCCKPDCPGAGAVGGCGPHDPKPTQRTEETTMTIQAKKVLITNADPDASKTYAVNGLLLPDGDAGDGTLCPTCSGHGVVAKVVN